MTPLATTRLSSKGQVVIPEEVRKALGLEPGARFVVLSDGHVVILKPIDAPHPSPSNSALLVTGHGLPSQIESAGDCHAYASHADTPTTRNTWRYVAPGWSVARVM